MRPCERPTPGLFLLFVRLPTNGCCSSFSLFHRFRSRYLAHIHNTETSSPSLPCLTVLILNILACVQSKSIHTILQLQQKLEEMELAHARGKQPLPTASPTGALVHAVDIPPNRRPHTAVTAVTNSWAESGRPPEGEAGRASSCSSSWSLPCVSVDTEGNSYFTDKKVALGPGTGAGIGALSELFPASGEDCVSLPRLPKALGFTTALVRRQWKSM